MKILCHYSYSFHLYLNAYIAINTFNDFFPLLFGCRTLLTFWFLMQLKVEPSFQPLSQNFLLLYSKFMAFYSAVPGLPLYPSKTSFIYDRMLLSFKFLFRFFLRIFCWFIPCCLVFLLKINMQIIILYIFIWYLNSFLSHSV